MEQATLDVMNQYHHVHYGNPSSLHGMGLTAEKAVSACRSRIAQMLSVGPENVIFTSGGTESNNLAIRGVVERRKKRGRKLITSKTEHPSVLEVFRYYEQEGWEVTYLDVDRQGRIQMDQLTQALDWETVLVSIMHINNETGVLQDIQAIGKCIKDTSPHVLFHSDGVQSFGKIPVHPASSQVDLLSISAHKVHGPKGLGALYVKKGVALAPLFLGGGQERALRSGTENVAAIAGWHQVLDKLDLSGQNAHMKRLKARFLEELLKAVPEVTVNSPLDDGFAHHILSVSFAHIKGEVLLHALEKRGIFVSTGSACSSKKNRDSHVLQQLGLEKSYLEGTLRFSFGKWNTEEEILDIFPILAEEVQAIRKFTRRR
jgi:cysteine desulfurase